MKRKKKYISLFLEALLVRQADGELKNTNGNLKEYFRAAQLGPNGGFNSGLSLASMALFSKKNLHPTLKESSTISAMSMSTGKDVIVATTHFLMEPTLLGSTKVMTLALSYEV